MYTIYVRFDCWAGRRERFIKEMKDSGILKAIREEDGCIKYDYYLSDREPDVILLVEQWESKEHQQIHIKQPHMDTMRSFKDNYIAKTTLGQIEFK